MAKEDQREVEAATRTPEQAAPNQGAGQSQDDPTARTGESPVSGQTVLPSSDRPAIPPASETWVEGQATSDADYVNDRGAKGPS